MFPLPNSEASVEVGHPMCINDIRNAICRLDSGIDSVKVTREDLITIPGGVGAGVKYYSIVLGGGHP